ncbi:unnamed protein product [Phaedon cochleariae]|uniref:Uncharacterized protein n=1 Tax=Phaedon cochleariae TaxID=80249 RepID=A0A9N9SJB5_PHACE|nr:unnamed protein product [Phaedon cochleariae]
MVRGKILCGGKSDFERVQKGVGEYFFEMAQKHQEKIFQIDGRTKEEETYSSVHQRSIRLASHLQKLGVTPDDIVVTCLKMTMDTVIPHIATTYLGAKFAALDIIQTEKDWTHCIGLVKPKLVFVDEDHLRKIEKCLKSLGIEPIIIVDGKSDCHTVFADLMKPSVEDVTFSPQIVEECHATAAIFFSSGTTGLPKAMCLSHFSFINKTISYFTMDICNPKVILAYSSFYWITGMEILTRMFFSGGCRIIAPSFHPEEAIRMIEEFKVTYCIINPACLKSIIDLDNATKYDTSSLHHLSTGGSPVKPNDLLDMRKLFKHSHVTIGYGCSETAGILTCFDFTRDRDVLDNVKSVGRCMKEVEIKVVDDLTRQPLGPNQDGEIWVRTPYLMNGYLNDETPSRLDEEGFLKTGDRGYYDADECFYIVGRSDDIFKYGVVKVDPDRWESVLAEHPAVREVGVFGIPHGSDGYLPAACIVLKDNVDATEKGIEDFFIGKMTLEHRIAGGIKFVDSLPRTPTAKLKRCELIELFNRTTPNQAEQ